MLPTLIAAILNCRVSFRVIRPVLFHPTDVAKQSVKRSQEWAWREVEISRRCRQDDRRRAGQRARGWRQNDDVRPGTTGEGGRVHGGCVERSEERRVGKECSCGGEEGRDDKIDEYDSTAEWLEIDMVISTR